MQYIKLVIILISCLFISACSSIVARTGQGEFGHPYSGPVQSVMLQPCGLMASAAGWFLPYPLVLADIPISLAVDTILLPIDLVMMPTAQPLYSNVSYLPPASCMFGGQYNG